MQIQYNDSNDLLIFINDFIEKKGVKKTHIANKMNISRQALDSMLKKQNFNIADLNRILNAMDYNATAIINIESINNMKYINRLQTYADTINKHSNYDLINDDKNIKD